MKAALMVLTLAALAQGALAQDALAYDPQVLDTCLAANVAAPHVCIGQAADNCTTNSGGSNVVFGFCNGAERDDWDARLNATYQSLLDSQATALAELREFRSDYPDMVERMRTMQRNWITYRDAACDWDYLQWGGGTGAGPSFARCQMLLTAQQTLFLQQWAR